MINAARFSIVGVPIVLACALLLTFGGAARAVELPTDIRVCKTRNNDIGFAVFAAPGRDKHPAVVLLHGARVIRHPHVFVAYAEHFAEMGFDTLVPSYSGTAEENRQTGPDIWTDELVDCIKQWRDGDRSDGRVGIMGFSEGGMTAVDIAGQDSKLAFIVAWYSRLGRHTRERVSRLPAFLEIHGAADKNIPVAEGTELVTFARGLGGTAEQEIYPDADHAFNLDTETPPVARANERAYRFIERTLAGK